MDWIFIMVEDDWSQNIPSLYCKIKNTMKYTFILLVYKFFLYFIIYNYEFFINIDIYNIKY